MICPSCGYDNIEGMDRCENCLKPLRDLDVPRAEATAGVVRSVMEDDLSELRQVTALTAEADEEVASVLARMKQGEAGCVLVLENDELVGAFTERDAARVLMNKDDADGRSIGEVVRHDVEVLSETDSIGAALNLVAIERRRYVPVVQQDGSYTVVSASGILEYIAHEDW